MGRIGARAVVLGASMAGLLAARVLTEAYGEVVIVDRDPLDGEAHRRGVPQGYHVHALLPSGKNVLDELFPCLVAELVGGGAPVARVAGDTYFSFGGHTFTKAAQAEPILQASRPYLESHVRRHVLALPQVSLRPGCDAVGLVADESGDRIVGTRIVPRAPGSVEEDIRADLVVDATGRSGRTPGWLAAMGYPTPPEERVKTGLSYVSRTLRLPPSALDGDLAVLIGAYPGRPRGMALFAQEGGRWLLTLAGVAGTKPPTDPDGFLDFAASVAPPRIFDAIRDAEPLSEIMAFRFPAQHRRRYERLTRFPAGLLVIGDALCSFNPIYGQGMSVAALEALRLRDCLRQGTDNLARRFFQAAAKEINPAWQAAASSDLALPEVEGERPRAIRLGNAWIARVQATATRDAAVAAAFLRVIALLDPASALLKPTVVARVLSHRLRYGRSKPATPHISATAHSEIGVPQ